MLNNLAFSGIEMWIGFYILMSIISYAILTSDKKTTPVVKNDNDALQIVNQVLENDEVTHYEVASIVRMEETQTTTVIIETDTQSISLEINNNSGKILSKEKLV